MTLILLGIKSDYSERNLIVADDLKIFLARYSELEDISTFMALRIDLWNDGYESVKSSHIPIENPVAEEELSQRVIIASLLKPVKKFAKEFLMIDDEDDYDGEDIERYYRKSEDGTYHITPDLSGTAKAQLIKDIIIKDSSRPNFRFMTTGSDGHADVIGMYCSRQYGIHLEFERVPETRDMFIFFKRR